MVRTQLLLGILVAALFAVAAPTGAQTVRIHFTTLPVLGGLPETGSLTTGPINEFGQGILYYPGGAWKVGFQGGTPTGLGPLELPPDVIRNTWLAGRRVTFAGVNNAGEYIGYDGQSGFLWDGRPNGTPSQGIIRIDANFPGLSLATNLTGLSSGPSHRMVGFTRELAFPYATVNTFLFDPARGYILGFDGFTIEPRNTYLVAVNNNGDTVGYYIEDGKKTGFVRTARGTNIIDDGRIYLDGQLTTWRSYETIPRAINDEGQVVGEFTSTDRTCLNGRAVPIPFTGCRRAFYYFNGEFHVINPDVPSATSVRVTGLTNKGIVLGSYSVVDSAGQSRTQVFYGFLTPLLGAFGFTREGLPSGALLGRRGEVWTWYSNGSLFAGDARLSPATDWRTVGAADLNRDGRNDLVWQDPGTGEVRVSFLAQTGLLGSARISGPTEWRAVGLADMNRDGHRDLIWQHPTSGEVWVWYLRDGVNFGHMQISGSTPWKAVGLGDLNLDGHVDLLWQHPDHGEVWVWYLGMAGRAPDQRISGPTPWKVVSLSDLNGDTRPDLVWQHPVTGEVWTWYLNDYVSLGHQQLSAATPWNVVGAADMNGDGRSDLLWQLP